MVYLSFVSRIIEQDKSCLYLYVIMTVNGFLSKVSREDSLSFTTINLNLALLSRRDM